MSKKLDEELESAVAALSPALDGGAPAVPRADTPKKTDKKLLAGLLVAAALLVGLFTYGFNGAARYAAGVDEILAQREQLVGRPIRVEGELVPGSLVKRDTPCEYRFGVRDATKTERQITVSYPHCAVPDQLRDAPGVQLTVEGKLRPDGQLDATNVLAKCSSKYDPKSHQLADPNDPAGVPTGNAAGAQPRN